jgi:tetratricopeptide (TPR) repeat protein
MPQAKAAAMKAIELDGSLGEAHASLGQIRLIYDWDWMGAEADFQQAIRLNSNYPTAHQWHGESLVSMGQFEQGLPELRKARDLDPLSLIINTNVGLNFYWARQYDRAIEQLERALELEPNFFRARLHLGMCYERKRMYPEAIAEFEKARSISENSWTLAGLGHCHASFGARARAENLLEQLLELSRHQFVSCATIAVVYAGFEDRVEPTMEWLEKAYEERSGLLIWLKVWPIFDHLRSDARFVRLLRRIGFATDAEQP